MQTKIIFLGTGGAEPVHFNFEPYLRRNSSLFIQYEDENSEKYGLLIDTPPDIAFSLIGNGIKLSDIDSIAYTHTHGDHFRPDILTVPKLGYFEIGDEKYKEKSLSVYGRKDVINSVKTVIERSLDILPTEVSEGHFSYKSRDGKDLLDLYETKYETQIHDKIKLISIEVAHGSRSIYTDERGNAVGYVVTIDENENEKNILYLPDVGSFKYSLENFIEYGKKHKYDMVIFGCPLPFYEESETPHADARTLMGAYNKLKKAGCINGSGQLYFTHLSPRWLRPGVTDSVFRMAEKYNIDLHLCEDGEEIILK